jgi:hypothetical protein
VLPDEQASAEEWRVLGRSAVGAFEALSARMAELGAPISEETAVMRRELRSARKAGHKA